MSFTIYLRQKKIRKKSFMPDQDPDSLLIMLNWIRNTAIKTHIYCSSTETSIEFNPTHFVPSIFEILPKDWREVKKKSSVAAALILKFTPQ
jgi:hypothetical protein